MIIRTIATGSTGNCYLLQHGEDQLLVEAGIPLQRIKRALGFKLSEVSGCLVSHSHGDHAKAVRDMVKHGIECLMSQETYGAVVGSERPVFFARIVEPLVQVKCGAWTILPFETEHDCPGCLGFLIAIDKYKILFATDTAYIKHKFTGLTHIMVECNYDEQTMQENVEAGTVNMAVKKRVTETHFGLENVLGFLKETDLSKVEQIHLIHLSNDNANQARIKKAVQAATGKQVIIP